MSPETFLEAIVMTPPDVKDRILFLACVLLANVTKDAEPPDLYRAMAREVGFDLIYCRTATEAQRQAAMTAAETAEGPEEILAAVAKVVAEEAFAKMKH